MRKLVRALVLVLPAFVACSRTPEVSSTETVTETATSSTTETTGTTSTATSAPQAPAESGLKLPPVDQASQDPIFLTFRQRVLDAVQRKDREALLSMISLKIRNDFGEGGGIEDFKRKWKLDSANSPLWSELEELLRMGGTFQNLEGDRRFCAPYVYSAYPENGPDAFESLVVLGENIPMREKPDSTSPVVATLSHNIVRIADQYKHPAGWRKVSTESGKTGWVEEKYLRSQIDYRACFMKEGGDWKMVLLVAGD
jgi:SH3 domain-containing protein